MAKCWRHFVALTKKNAILWSRTPICAVFEFAVPAFLMAMLCVVRINVPSTPVDAAGTLADKLWTYPSVSFLENWSWGMFTSENPYSNERNIPLVMYSNYTRDTHDPLDDYDMGYDWYGPQFFFPTHCM